MTELSRLLAETIAWCRLHVSVDDPSRSLRTPHLRPTNLAINANQGGNFGYEWGTVEENQVLVSDLAGRRAQLLRAENAYPHSLQPDLAGGRLLIADPEESDWCGLSIHETAGFIDDFDVPAWDTWACYLHETITPDPQQVRKSQEALCASYGRDSYADWQPASSVSYILCWIPPQLIAMVEMGIRVNPVECFFWATEYKRRHHSTELLRGLDMAGILR
jgi:hypothetical protein